MQVRLMIAMSQAVTEAQSALEALGWVDITAAAIVLVFSILGLFTGLVWQVSRIATLVVAYVLAAMYGPDVGNWIFHDSPQGTDAQLPLYVAYISIFIVVLVVLSLLALLLNKLVEKAGLTFYNRVGGGVLGVGTGALVVLLMLAIVFMFFPQGSGVAAAARSSHSAEYGRRAVDMMGTLVPDGVREIFGPESAEAPATGR